jgi:uncharacterized membrane protein YpjA
MTYYAWFFVFAVVLYLIATDESVAAAFYYVFKLIKFNYEKQKWWLLHNPANPIVKYFMWRRAMKLAKEIEKQIQNKSN